MRFTESTNGSFPNDLQGICKDCGHGTLDNSTAPAFRVLEYEETEYLICAKCGSQHLDIVWEQARFVDAGDL